MYIQLSQGLQEGMSELEVLKLYLVSGNTGYSSVIMEFFDRY